MVFGMPQNSTWKALDILKILVLFVIHGRIVYLPTWNVDFYGFHECEYIAYIVTWLLFLIGRLEGFIGSRDWHIYRHIYHQEQAIQEGKYTIVPWILWD